MNTNSQNPKTGKGFELVVKAWFEAHYEKGFVNNKPFNIGNPPKPHRFDVVSNDNSIVAECKCYTWTETGNIPSAKMGFVNEASFYLSFIHNAATYIVMKKSAHVKRTETLADYYFRTNRHLLGNTRILEYDVEQGIMREIG
ncbi:MAG: hypothetical protein FWE20_05230 [Defluviitaleaceae bacterium]|nr:hypothetical protein [Defluviitaleaceae bacterium]